MKQFGICLGMTGVLLVLSGSVFPDQSLQSDLYVSAGFAAMHIKSSAFRDGGLLLSMYTCDGQDLSPPLSWDPVPEGTKSFVLICDDPDAPVGTWIHWVVCNIPPNKTSLPEKFGNTTEKTLAEGIIQGKNSGGTYGYGGPCPPRSHGEHRYFFKVYALDTLLTFKPEESITKETVLEKMKGHILAYGQIMGRYKRKYK